MVIISLELTRVNPDRNIFSINVELTSTFLLYRGLVHHYHRILNKDFIVSKGLYDVNKTSSILLISLFFLRHKSSSQCCREGLIENNQLLTRKIRIKVNWPWSYLNTYIYHNFRSQFVLFWAEKRD